ncbi:TetR/AcrR family transcriptional regulator [Variovorax sp. J22G73]|jgi:AcrR family transcriptional regulator|uniref:TetR/AcrR family transcriptional regulator n=1 Tax=unclassified Variovorax TaxID=663243 RepID=UPI000D5CC08E|nr:MULTISPECIES: TetR/AcrR family transcriptional regulator [unclassified Variovorax]MDM0003674.1 TetR/AcrR family transcriptional regulator [Variovorax sp. J22R203]MDM0096660.1 TetR/AcrR family transcriptional regulator [Variovorax sp. J22G73]
MARSVSPPSVPYPSSAEPAGSAGSSGSPWEPAGKRARQREVKRQAVLQTAAQLFNERGFHATSLDDIAERLNVSKPTLYYYVENKDQILLECVKTALDLMHAGIAEVRANGGSAIDQLEASMRIYAGVVTQDFGRCVIRIGEDPLPKPLKAELLRLKAGIDAQFRQLVEAGIAEGSLAPCDPKMAAFMLAGALSWIGRWYRPGGSLTPTQIADQGIDLLLGGLLQRPAPASPPATGAAPRQSAAKKGKTA